MAHKIDYPEMSESWHGITPFPTIPIMDPMSINPQYISDLTARQIASDWHGGQDSALYALSSSGAIIADAVNDDFGRDVRVEIEDNIRYYTNTEDPEIERLTTLLAYVEYHGERGAQTGWANLIW